MNGKRAKAIRRLAKFSLKEDRKQKREYEALESQDYNGNTFKVPSTHVSTGVRRDYRILKDYFQGKDVILPNHLRGVVGV